MRRKGDIDNPVCFGTRRFTLYDSDYYRKSVQGSRVPTHDIQAFPLPEQEAKYLFGPIVAGDYFVVRFSVRNTRNDDKLVSMGMIVAYGRAIVSFSGEPGNAFTIPVNVSPQSTVHMYSILDDREAFQPRAWAFRSLEFIGALAAITATTYGGDIAKVPEDFVIGTTLFSGVFIPELKKLWPDQWPGYKRNLVAYGMPELIKIPKNTVSNQKYLFFSKEKIQAVVADQTLFIRKYFNFWNFSSWGKSIKEPDVRVISLAFDNLEVPFENVFTPTETDVKERLFRAQARLGQRLETLRELKADSQETNILGVSLTPTLFSQLSSESSRILNLISTNETSITNTETLQYLRPALTNILVLANHFSNQLFRVDLFENRTAGASSLNALETLQQELARIQRRMLGYSDVSSFEPQVAAVENAITANERAVDFYRSAAETLAEPGLLRSLQALDSIELLNKPTQSDREAVITAMHSVREARTGLRVVPAFYPEALNPGSPPVPEPQGTSKEPVPAVPTEGSDPEKSANPP